MSAERRVASPSGTGGGKIGAETKDRRSEIIVTNEVWFEETGERREVVGYCRVCRATPDEDVMLVSPQGIAHHADGDTTDCGHDATGPAWWWRT